MAGTKTYEGHVYWDGVPQVNHLVWAIQQHNMYSFAACYTEVDGHFIFRRLSNDQKWLFVVVDPSGYYPTRVLSGIIAT